MYLTYNKLVINQICIKPVNIYFDLTFKVVNSNNQFLCHTDLKDRSIELGVKKMQINLSTTRARTTRCGQIKTRPL